MGYTVLLSSYRRYFKLAGISGIHLKASCHMCPLMAISEASSVAFRASHLDSWCAGYLSTFTNQSIVIAMGVPSVQQLFSERHYADLEGASSRALAASSSLTSRYVVC